MQCPWSVSDEYDAEEDKYDDDGDEYDAEEEEYDDGDDIHFEADGCITLGAVAVVLAHSKILQSLSSSSSFLLLSFHHHY